MRFSQDNTVSDCEIRSVANEFHGAPGIAVFYARGTSLVHNEISMNRTCSGQTTDDHPCHPRTSFNLPNQAPNFLQFAPAFGSIDDYHHQYIHIYHIYIHYCCPEQVHCGEHWLGLGSDHGDYVAEHALVRQKSLYHSHLFICRNSNTNKIVKSFPRQARDKHRGNLAKQKQRLLMQGRGERYQLQQHS